LDEEDPEAEISEDQDLEGEEMIGRLVALTAIGLVGAGCAEAPHLTTRSEAASNEQRMLELERQAVRSRLEVDRLQQRVAELERELAQRTAPTPPPAVERPATTPAPQASPAPASRANVEESDLDELPPSVVATVGASYEAALAALRDGRPAEAESRLRAFVAANRDSDLADNAWFWIGESRAVRGDNAGAIEAYRTTIETYPEGNKVPDALLKLGLALESQGDRSSAREVWSELVKRFPTTAAAETARVRLASGNGGL
jgi:tol-pal system protein YbgF